MPSGKWAGPRRAYSRDWHRVRTLVKRRSGGRCEQINSGSRCANAARDVDHIINLRAGGTDTLDNAQHLCKQCHNDKTQREAKNAKKISSRLLPRETDPFDLM